MTYLSKLVLDPRSRAVRHDLGNCHELHRTILKAFPAAPDGASAREHFSVLYRVENQDRSGGIRVLVQSRVEPNWSHLASDYLLTDTRNPDCKRLDEQYARLFAGMPLFFRLRANPTKRIHQRNEHEINIQRWHGKRVELRGEEQQLAWLGRKGERGGFRLLHVRTDARVADVRTAPAPNVTGSRPQHASAAGDPRERQRLTFGSVLFEGKLEVVNAERFRETLGAGIGSGKAYGFGLISVIPAPHGVE